ncbi:MAG: hypothetical protein JWN27_3873 [Candidatus Eremiobacteraeota bacterium]|nr:hypothetical protein [Candidatus Eremiobacteraeota bacterium]
MHSHFDLGRRGFLGAFAATGAAFALPSAVSAADAAASPAPAPSAEPCDPIACANGIPLAQLNDRRPITLRPTTEQLAADAAMYKRFQTAFQAMIDFGTEYPTDPRGWNMQQAIHGEMVAKFSDSTHNVHHGWYFLTWHRAYLYFLERILAWHLAQRGATIDQTFRMPVWDWEATETNVQFPTAYGNVWMGNIADGNLNPLWVAQRDYKVPLNLVALGANMQVMLSAPNSGPANFYGAAPIAGNGRNRQGAGENKAHNLVHNWVGGGFNGPSDPGTGWMSDLSVAAKDPLFFAHHANIDKVWAWYRSFKYSDEPASSDYRDVTWTFFDEQKRCVNVAAKDLIDYKNALRYHYAPVPSKYTGPPPPNAGRPLALTNGHLGAVAAPPPGAKVGLTLTDVPYKGSGTFEIIARGPSGSAVLGSFTITAHRGMNMGNSTDVFLLVSEPARALLNQASTKIVVQKVSGRSGLLGAAAGVAAATELTASKATLFVH